MQRTAQMKDVLSGFPQSLGFRSRGAVQRKCVVCYPGVGVSIVKSPAKNDHTALLVVTHRN